MRKQLLLFPALLLTLFVQAQPGTVDQSFQPATSRFSGIVLTAVQPDGKILVYGFDEESRGEGLIIARYLPNGVPDSSFRSPYLDPRTVVSRDLLVQNDGKVLLMANTPEGVGIGRLNADGSRDATLLNGVRDIGTPQNALALTPGQKILTAIGSFSCDGSGECVQRQVVKL
ncbi:MAG: hypothetical protein EOO11_16250 [Chitinophagaceae bacterium]|nr:MAG: hypothetical protein EOO11_16250 [Chitinophagaceae bacterium]